MASSSASSSSSSSTSAGPASLGQMSSLSPECTPLKHRYDHCFNRWFERYLDITTPGSYTPSVPAAGATSTDGAANPATRKRSFWSRATDSDPSTQAADASGSSAAAGQAAADELERRRRLRDELETQCGALFGEYKGCVKKALDEKDILPLLSTARQLNPFPFSDASEHDSLPRSRSEDENDPFPFSKAKKEDVEGWEKKQGW